MPKHILIVEDDINIAELIRLYLEKDSFKVSIAYDGKTGMDLFRKENPDLILLDIILKWTAGLFVKKSARTATHL